MMPCHMWQTVFTKMGGIICQERTKAEEILTSKMAATAIMYNAVAPQESVFTISRTPTAPLTIEIPTNSPPPLDDNTDQIHNYALLCREK